MNEFNLQNSGDEEVEFQKLMKTNKNFSIKQDSSIKSISHDLM